MTRRNNGDGSFRKRSNGFWEFRQSYDGETVSCSGRTKAEARAKMRDKLERLRSGRPATDATITVGQLLELWRRDPLDARTTRRGPMKESTKTGYRTLIELYIIGRHDAKRPERTIEPDAIARVRLDKLKPAHVEGLIARLRDRSLAESSVRSTYHVLRLALAHAVDNDLIARNPAEKIARPVAGAQEARYLTTDELVRLLEAARQYRYHEVLTLIAATGMRRGEALALKWEHIDLEAGVVEIRGTLARLNGVLAITSTKTRGSQRSVYLSPGVVTLLKVLRAAQRVERVAAANVWTECGFVFTTEFGKPVDPRNVFRTMQQAAKRAKLANVGIHSLRHSWASAAVNGGAPLSAAQVLLGHADLRTTQRYLHTDPELRRSVGTQVAVAIGL